MNGNEKFSHFSRVHSILWHNNRKACHRITWRSFYVHHTTTQQQYSHNNHFVSAHSRGRHWRFFFLQRYVEEFWLCVLPEMEHVYCPSSPGFLFIVLEGSTHCWGHCPDANITECEIFSTVVICDQVLNSHFRNNWNITVTAVLLSPLGYIFSFLINLSLSVELLC